MTLSPNDLAQLLRDRITALGHERDRFAFGFEAAIGELQTLLARIEPLPPVEQPAPEDADFAPFTLGGEPQETPTDA